MLRQYQLRAILKVLNFSCQWPRHLKGRDNLGDLDIDGKVEIVRMCIGLIWLRGGSSGGLLWTR